MVIWKSIPCSVEIEYFVDSWGQYIVGELENYGMAAAERVGQLFGVSLKSWLLNRL